MKKNLILLCNDCQREDAPCEKCLRNEELTTEEKEITELKDFYYHN